MGCEGFLKPISGKCMEVVAKEYFDNLVDRNLILVKDRGHKGETIKCKFHDLLMDVCLREAQKHKFLCVAKNRNFNNPEDLNTQRRIVVHDGTMPEVIHSFLFHHGSLVRSLTCKYIDSFLFHDGSLVRYLTVKYPDHLSMSSHSGLLRVLNVINIGEAFPRMSFMGHTNEIVNCRYISGLSVPSLNPTLPSSIFSLWNLQTFYVRKADITTSKIWKMSQLRHVHFNRLNLLDPPPSGHTNNERDDFVLGNLQTLSCVRNFKISEDVVKRILNIKELGVRYEGIEDWSSYCLNNLVRLDIESLSFAFGSLGEPIPSGLLENLTFPHSLKELSLDGTKLNWGDLGTNIGSLPHLQVLKLEWGAVVGTEWETVEGQFSSLKYLKISNTDLIHWITESWTHFPYLEHIVLTNLTKLKEIPSEIGETLKSTKMWFCSKSAVFSAKEILTEQEDLGNEGLHVQVIVRKGNNSDVESLVAHNFQVITY